jgi:hypothetical protein
MEKRLMTVEEFTEYTAMGRTKGVRWAKSIGAVKRAGRRILIDRVILDKAIDEMPTEKE